jgi:hypothetical protein
MPCEANRSESQNPPNCNLCHSEQSEESAFHHETTQNEPEENFNNEAFRQGTASAVPRETEKAGGFSR